jgi:hypothetical protein
MGLVLSVASALSLSPRSAAADPVSRADVERALSGYEQSVDVAAASAWGPAGAAHLMAIARDADAVVAVRARALHALRAFPGSAPVRAFLLSTAASPSQDVFLLRASLDALVEGFDDVAEASRYLADARVDVRDGAVWSLGASRNPAARAALRDRLRVEPDAGVRATITDALSRAPVVGAVAAPPITVTLLAPARRAAPRARSSRRR